MWQIFDKDVLLGMFSRKCLPKTGMFPSEGSKYRCLKGPKMYSESGGPVRQVDNFGECLLVSISYHIALVNHRTFG